MVVRFVFVIRAVPVCARAPRVCPVCVPAPPGVFRPGHTRDYHVGSDPMPKRPRTKGIRDIHAERVPAHGNTVDALGWKTDLYDNSPILRCNPPITYVMIQ